MKPTLSRPSITIFLCSIFLLGGQSTLFGQESQNPSRSSGNDIVYFSQGFDQLALPTGWSVSQVVGPVATWTFVGNGSNPPIPPFSGAGQAKFNSFDAGIGQQARLTSRVFNLSSAADPILQFYMYHENEFLSSYDSLYVEISTVDSIAGPWTTLRGLARLSPTSGWRKETIALTSFIGNSRCFVSFRGVSKFGNNIFIDEVSVQDSIIVRDIGLVGIINSQTSGLLPTSKLKLDGSRDANTRSDFIPSFLIIDRSESITLGAIVQNFGTVNEIAYQVRWMLDGIMQTPANNVLTLLRNGRDTLTLNWTNVTPGLHNITAWASLLADSNALNDTARLVIQIPDSSVIFSEAFNGSTFPPTGWMVINRDGGTLLPWFQGTSISPLTPFEGMGYAADNFQRANGNYLDDYLISSPIPGVAVANQTDSLTFWCRSTNYPPPNPNYPDSMMVLLSTTGTDTSHFTIVVDHFPVPKSGWTRKGYRLNSHVPQSSTVYVAFRYLHYNVANADFVGIDAVQISRSGPTSREEEEILPKSFMLLQNYPNPFNPVTRISFSLPRQSKVSLKVFDVLGKEVATLIDDDKTAGYHTIEWTGSGSSNIRVASGVYFYKIEARSTIETYVSMKKMLLMK